jgi:hypothetical protein
VSVKNLLELEDEAEKASSGGAIVWLLVYFFTTLGIRVASAGNIRIIFK